MCFPVNIAEFLILPILKNIWKRLLFNFFNGSLLHGPKGHPEVLKQVSTCIWKPKTNTFDKSIKFLHWLFMVVLDGLWSFFDGFRSF